jgi:hypothetical protein
MAQRAAENQRHVVTTKIFGLFVLSSKGPGAVGIIIKNVSLRERRDRRALGNLSRRDQRAARLKFYVWFCRFFAITQTSWLWSVNVRLFATWNCAVTP